MVNTFIEIIVIILYIYVFYKYFAYKKCCEKNIKINNINNLSGIEIIQKILDKNKLDKVYIVQTKNPYYYGYSTKRKVLRVSKKLFNDTTVTDTYQAALLASYAVEDSKNDKFYMYSYIKTLLYVLNIICYIGIIISAFLRDFYIIKICLVILILIILITMFISNYEYKLLSKIIDELVSDKILIKNDEELLNNISNKVVIQPIQIVTKFIDYINYKLNN